MAYIPHLFLGFSQIEVDGTMPSEATMFNNMFEQVDLADHLGFNTAWIGGAHFSLLEMQHAEPPVLPHFRGEICLNTDIIQLASTLMSRTKRIHIGSAIHNVLCNGGPIAHAEALRTFLTLKQHMPYAKRRLRFGIGTGRFNIVNETYGIRPRNDIEHLLWPAMRGKILAQAYEILLRLARGETLQSDQLCVQSIAQDDCRDASIWTSYCNLAETTEPYIIPSFWEFSDIRLIPKEVDLETVDFVLGTQDAKIQAFANRFHPCWVFNLSITPPEIIEETHERMHREFHPEGGAWKRRYMPQTVMVFVEADDANSDEENRAIAQEDARKAMEAYWSAMSGTIDQAKVEQGVSNALVGTPQDIVEQVRERYHANSALMLWFDFNDHHNERVMRRMRIWMERVQPLLDVNE